jgi:AbrB family looped-hinge helix DNA binding protein
MIKMENTILSFDNEIQRWEALDGGAGGNNIQICQLYVVAFLLLACRPGVQTRMHLPTQPTTSPATLREQAQDSFINYPTPRSSTLRQYQVTRKRQITIPKALAERRGIKPGDSVFFEEKEGAIVIKKASRRTRRQDRERVEAAIEAFSKDVPLIRKRIKEAEAALIENFSRHISPE